MNQAVITARPRIPDAAFGGIYRECCMAIMAVDSLTILPFLTMGNGSALFFLTPERERLLFSQKSPSGGGLHEGAGGLSKETRAAGA